MHAVCCAKWARHAMDKCLQTIFHCNFVIQNDEVQMDRPMFVWYVFAWFLYIVRQF